MRFDDLCMIVSSLKEINYQSEEEYFDSFILTASYLLSLDQVLYYRVENNRIVKLLVSADSSQGTHESATDAVSFFNQLLDNGESGVISPDRVKKDWPTAAGNWKNGFFFGRVISGGRCAGLLIVPDRERHGTFTEHDALLFSAMTDIIAFSVDSIRRANEIEKAAAEKNKLIDDMRDKIETIQSQNALIATLSTPILELWNGILVLPVVGMMDTQRSATMMDALLDKVVKTEATGVIIDITGVDIVDTKTADHFIKLARAIRMLGAEPVITGISPAIAQTLTHIDIDLSGICTMRALGDGLKQLLERQPDDDDNLFPDSE